QTAEGARGFEVSQVADVKEVEAAVREDDRLAGLPPLRAPPDGLLPTHHTQPDLRSALVGRAEFYSDRPAGASRPVRRRWHVRSADWLRFLAVPCGALV